MRFDLMLRGGRVLDPASGMDGAHDVAMRSGRIAAVAPHLDPAQASAVIDVRDQLVIPGIVDCHVHIAEWLGGASGHRMLAAAGVTTAIDHAGPVDEVLRTTVAAGAGLNVGALSAVIPGRTVSGREPSRAELDAMVSAAMAQGALGVKLLGGHYPLSPEASGRVIDAANAARAYVSFHIGTTDNPDNDINALRQTLEIAGSNRLHLPHINSYCRGYVLGNAYEEIQVALELLRGAPNVVSESHLSIWNGTSGACRDGVPESNVTKKSLRLGGYPVSEAGLRQALLDDYCRTIMERGGLNTAIGKQDGLEAWGRAGSRAMVSFPVNVAACLMACATARDASGAFVIDALASDGGGLPRNNLIAGGLALVRFGAFSLSDWVTKVTRAPAKLFGLHGKGHLAPGADADVTVIDLRQDTPVLGIAAGTVIMVDGVVVGRGGTFLTTPRGRAAVEALGLSVSLVSPDEMQLYSPLKA